MEEKKSKIRQSGHTSSGAIPTQVLNADYLPDSTLMQQPAVENILGISGNTVWRWTRTGILKATRIGRTTRWRLGELRATIRVGGARTGKPGGRAASAKIPANNAISTPLQKPVPVATALRETQPLGTSQQRSAK